MTRIGSAHMRYALEDWIEYTSRRIDLARRRTVQWHRLPQTLGELAAGAAVALISSQLGVDAAPAILWGAATLLVLLLGVFVLNYIRAPVALEQEAESRDQERRAEMEGEYGALEAENARLLDLLPTDLDIELQVPEQRMEPVTFPGGRQHAVWTLRQVRITNLSHANRVSLGFSFEATVIYDDKETWARRTFNEFAEREVIGSIIGETINGPLVIEPMSTVTGVLAFYIGRWRLTYVKEAPQELLRQESLLHVTDAFSRTKVVIPIPYDPLRVRQRRPDL